MGDFQVLRPTEQPRASRKPLPGRKVRSLDKTQDSRMNSESKGGQCLSLPTTPCRSLENGNLENSAGSSETHPGSTATALQEEESQERLLGGQSTPPQDSKKDKSQKGWLKTLMNFLKLDPEEPKEKVKRKSKEKEVLPSPAQIPETPEPLALRKKAHDKKGGHRRLETPETQGTRELESGLPGKASTSHSEEAPHGPPRRGQQTRPRPLSMDASRHPPHFLRARPLSMGKVGAGTSLRDTTTKNVLEKGRERSSYHHSLLSQSRQHQPEEKSRKPDKDVIIENIVEFLKKVAIECEKQNAAGTACPESLPPRRPTCLALSKEDYGTPTHSSSGLEEAEVPAALDPEGGDRSFLDVCLRGARSCEPEENLAQDKISESKEAVIKMIVEFLKMVGDKYDIEQLQTPQLEVFEPNPAPPFKKKLPEKKTSLKRVFSLKKQGSEEPKRAGTSGTTSLESRPPKRPTFLALCVGGQRPSTPSSSDLEEVEVPETLCPKGEDHSPLDVSLRRAENLGPKEDLAQDKVSKSKEAVIKMIVEFLQKVGDQYETEQLQAPELEVFKPNPTPPFKKKLPEKKTSLKRVFSLKKIGSEEPKRAGTSGTTSLESRPPKRPTFLALCVGGQRPSTPSSSDLDAPSPIEGRHEGSSEIAPQARGHKPERSPLEGATESELMVTKKLEDFLQEVGDELGEQVRQHPCLKKCLQEILDSCQAKLLMALRGQETHSLQHNRNQATGPYQFPFDLPNKFAGNSHNVISLLNLLGHYHRRRNNSSGSPTRRPSRTTQVLTSRVQTECCPFCSHSPELDRHVQ